MAISSEALTGMNDNGGSVSSHKMLCAVWVYRAQYCADAAFLKAAVFETGFSPSNETP